MKIKDLLPGIKKNVSLKNYTTFKIGGRAKYFFVAKNKTELIKATLVAKKINLPFFIFGRGSNILVFDKGYKGLVIKALNTKYKILNTKILAEAGTMLGKLVNAAANSGLTGLEWAAGIPGTVGGAIYGNAGAFGKSMKDIVKEVEVYDIKNKKIKIFKNKDCKFDYRDSIFKKKKNQSTKQSFVLGRAPKHIKNLCARCSDLIVLSTVLQLKKGKKKEIEKKIREYLSYRKKTQPLGFPSAGSVFKNPPGLSAGLRPTHRPRTTPVRGVKKSPSSFSAGELIEMCGLEGKRIGNVKISDIHPNFILNLGKGKARDVKKLINLIKKKVKNKFKINLKEEIQYLGF